MKTHGFTLIELMIVVAIMALLTTIAVPNFMRFLAKAKRAEAYVNLHSIYAAEKAYWAENGSYTSNLSGPSSVGWKPDGYTNGGKNEKILYSYGFPGAEGKNHFTGNLEAQASSMSAGHADTNSFVAVAAGDIDGDGIPDIMTIDNNNVIKILSDDLAD